MDSLFNFLKKNMGNVELEAQTLSGVFRSFIGKILQIMASTKLPVGSMFRCNLERLRGVKVGKNVFLGGGNNFDRVRPDLITIEDNVSIAGNVTILTHSRPPKTSAVLINSVFTKLQPVLVKKGAWITVNCIILPGVIIGEYSIITAGSVVTKDIPDFSIATGNPAKVVSVYKRR